MMHFLSSIGAFAVHLAVSIALVVGFVLAYMRSTPHDEIDLIRKGNAAAAVAVAGALIGYAIVLSRAIVYSEHVGETVLWGLIGLAVQVAGHFALSRVLPRLYDAIEQGDMAAGITKAALAVTLGILNAACMTP